LAGRQNFGWGGHTDSVCEVYSGAKIQKTSQKSAPKPRRSSAAQNEDIFMTSQVPTNRAAPKTRRKNSKKRSLQPLYYLLFSFYITILQGTNQLSATAGFTFFPSFVALVHKKRI
jgi:hypothetical protein